MSDAVVVDDHPSEREKRERETQSFAAENVSLVFPPQLAAFSAPEGYGEESFLSLSCWRGWRWMSCWDLKRELKRDSLSISESKGSLGSLRVF